MNLIKININNKISLSKNITNYLNPDYIYIPYDKKYKLHIKENDEILKESIILSNNDNYIYSSVSGKVKGAKIITINNKKIPTIIIENNFKEKTKKLIPAVKNMNNLTKKEFNDLMIKYNAIEKPLKGNKILINGIDYEPLEETYKHIIKKYSSELLVAIDTIYDIFKAEKCIFSIPNNNSDVAEKLVYQIGTYPNIKMRLIPNLYPSGDKDILIKEVMKTDTNLIYLNVEEVLAIYNVLRKRRPITEKLVTISGDLINKNKVINVKLGTSLKDIIEDNFKILDENYHIVINGLLSGYEVDSLDIVINKNIRSIFINKINLEEKHDCINCGMCHIKCPVGCDPRFNLNMENCIECGICTYICPAKKNLSKESDNYEKHLY